MTALLRPVRTLLESLRDALENDGIRRIEAYWTLGIAADAGLLVVLLIEVYAREGVVAAGVLGAVRMVPGVLSGMLSGGVLARFRAERVLLVLGLIRVLAAVACAIEIAIGGSTLLLYVLAGILAAAAAPSRPVSATLFPAVARSPHELVAANMTWSTGEGLGSMIGPFVVGLFVAVGRPELGAAASAVAFLLGAVFIGGLRFEDAADAPGATGTKVRGLRLLDGFRTMRRRPVVGWTLLAVFAQILTRGLLTPLTVVAAIELLAMGEPGVGLLNGALGLGGLLGAIFAVTLTRTDRLIRTEAAAVAWWGAPIAIIGLLPQPEVALVAMVAIGVANAVFDIAIFTVFQRGTSNEERAPVFALLEGIVGLGLVLGSLLGPVLLAVFGIRGALAITGAVLPIVALVVYGRIGRADHISVVDEGTLQLLRAVPVFEELPLTAFERLAAALEPLEFAAGDTIMREGDHGDRFVVIDSGEVEVSADGRPMSRLGHGAGVGEIALLRRSARTATVTAVTPVHAYGIACHAFIAAVSGPAAAAVTERIADANLRRGSASAPAPEGSAA
ncbi:MAG TPA: cyclic nucleotide-binding domain-containing protein [Candidatus Limnocylindrales bacterium]|jgi:MFS family permease|nr:cyclic nucleotide-binding domain-containing protein [Candidatus Limnocylindrales bacterium]